MRSSLTQHRMELYVVLIAAVAQGWALYGLHVALREDLQITDWSLFPALYVLALFAPLTVQLLARFARQRLFWLLATVLAAVLFALTWHQASLREMSRSPLWRPTNLIPALLALSLLWLHVMPFLHARLDTGRWRARYPDLFAASWRNVLVLLEAGVFTLALWLLLLLWGRLFAMLDIDFFVELFREPLFVYPVTALAFGLAIHLIGSVDRIVSVVLEQVLSLFKWLGLVAGVILVFFSVALVAKLPALIETGTRAIGAHWLLWLVALTVLLVNAAWRDGSNPQPYPRWIGNALRCALPLLVLVSLTALYALVVRVDSYGLTVSRVGGFVVAAIALAYALGYSLAALRRGPWLASLGSTNVAVALAFIVLMLLLLTPPLSPQRLTASSQHARALRASDERAAQQSLRALRFEAGRYGVERLRALQGLTDHPRAASLRAEAARLLALDDRSRYDARQVAPGDLDARLTALRIFPAGRTLDAPLRAALFDQDPRRDARIAACLRNERCIGLFVDLDGLPGEEFVLLAPYSSVVLQRIQGTWSRAAVSYPVGAARWDDLLEALQRGDVLTQAPRWQELRIGQVTLPAVRDFP